MTEASRRNFLTLAGAGIAAAGVAATVPTLTGGAAGADAAPATLSLPQGATGSIAAFVHDVEKGEVAVMVEGREVVVTDHQLVARLAHVLHTAGL